jgi:hypothetical protein
MAVLLQGPVRVRDPRSPRLLGQGHARPRTPACGFLSSARADMMRQAISLCACLALCTDVALAMLKPPLSHWAVPDRGGDVRNRTRPTSADCKELYFDQLVSIHGLFEGTLLTSSVGPSTLYDGKSIWVSRACRLITSPSTRRTPP